MFKDFPTAVGITHNMEKSSSGAAGSRTLISCMTNNLTYVTPFPNG